MRKRYPLDMPPSAVCDACGHPASDHRPELPSPCLHGCTDPTAIFPEQPGYGCRCIGFVRPRSMEGAAR